MKRTTYIEQQIPTTATFEVTGINEKGGREQQFKHIYHHALHLPNEKHANKDILNEYTAFQLHDDYDANEHKKKQLLYALCGDYVKQHDQKMIKQRKTSKCFNDVDTYLKQVSKQNKSFCRRVIGTFGNYDTMQRLYDEYGENLVRKASAKALAQFVDDFNKQHKHVQIIHYVTNSDEKGAPHVHMQMLGLSKSAKTGKPSVTFNNALRDEFGGKGGKDTMALFRDSVDNQLVTTFDKVLHEEIKQPLPHFKLQRLNPDSDDKGIDFNVYKGAMSASDELTKREEKLDEREQRLQQQEEQLQQQRMMLLQQAKAQEEHEKEIQHYEERVKAWDRNASTKLRKWQQIEKNLHIALGGVASYYRDGNEKFEQYWQKDPTIAIVRAFDALRRLPERKRTKVIEKNKKIMKRQRENDIDIDL